MFDWLKNLFMMEVQFKVVCPDTDVEKNYKVRLKSGESLKEAIEKTVKSDFGKFKKT